MKKAILLLLICICAISPAFTQENNDIKSVKEVVFYGIDFSKVKFFGVKETPLQLKYGLCQINDFFTTEAKKYNIPKYMKKDVIAYSLKQNQKINEAIDEEQLIGDSNKNNISENDIRQIVNNLSYGDNDQTGLVFVAEMLDKASAIGTYQVIFFDEATKEVLYKKTVSGKAGGFGVRNYWARSIFEVLRNWKY